MSDGVYCMTCLKPACEHAIKNATDLAAAEAEVARLRGEVKRLTREYEEATGKRPPIVSCKGDPAWHIAVVQERDALRAELAEANKARGELYDLQAKAVDALERAETERDAALRAREFAEGLVEEAQREATVAVTARDAAIRERDEARAEGRRIVEETRLFRLAAGAESAALRSRLEEAERLLREFNEKQMGDSIPCTICGEAIAEHAPDCALAAFLAASGPKEESR